MSLALSLAAYFTEGARQKGLDYHRLGLVRIVSVSDREVHATVFAHRAFDVRVWQEGKGWGAECGCPDAESSRCGHIWATLLETQARGHLGTGLADHPDTEVLPPEEDDLAGLAGEGQRLAEEAQASDRPHALRGEHWRERLWRLRGEAFAIAQEAPWPAGRELFYVVDVDATLADSAGLCVAIAQRQRKRDEKWGQLKPFRIASGQLAAFPDPSDRRILSMMVGARRPGYYGSYQEYRVDRFFLATPLDRLVLPLLCETGRCRLRRGKRDEPAPLSWDGGEAWRFQIDLESSGDDCVVTGALVRGGERQALATALLLLEGGLAVFPEQAAALDHAGAFEWIRDLRRGPLKVPRAKLGELMGTLAALPRPPHVAFAPGFPVSESRPAPRPTLEVRSAQDGRGRLVCAVAFDYGGESIRGEEGGWALVQDEQAVLLRRDCESEAAALARLTQLGVRRLARRSAPAVFEMAPGRLANVVRTLTAEGWRVEAEGKLYRSHGPVRLSVVSGIDWFDLKATVEFGDQVVPLPKVLAALRRGENTILLGDGTLGMLPEEWLARYGRFADFGSAEGERLRFGKSQAGLLDALLSSQPEASVDEAFARARASLARFDGIDAVDPPASFVGTLRGYQREGLGWFAFLAEFGFGGCLADDMGLGKTVQVLALLESRRLSRRRGRRRAQSSAPRPSLVVVPKSLVFNWCEEAERFTPRLRILIHVGPERARSLGGFEDCDVVLTTYGTLRRDALLLKDACFDYVVLDEAQAIKNAHTDSAKATRLLQADHRLALSGTPVENHLGELWSLFEFLNPGMLGRASAFRFAPDDAEPESRRLLARALRPFILRRTKEQVAQDLPEKMEQTLFCEMEPSQASLCDELRAHYRQSLLGRIEKEGLPKSKIQILEALLRLRQAACHPGLIDPARAEEPCAKLDVLMPRLQEVRDEGHKALVFSQFTSFLAILRNRVDEAGLAYAYLDGKTRDRQEPVRRFQQDPACGLFLISLKAGGLGLNLTAAQYVFLLDPWWNPAVEAQAIDRSHRIGQTRQVFAYRLVARGSIEEKVLALQEGKRALADAIIGADNSLIRSLGREDLQLLLS